MNFSRMAVSTLVLLQLLMPLWAQEDVDKVTTDFGNYQVLRLTGITAPFEISDSLKYGVTGEPTADSREYAFRSFNVDNPDVVLAETLIRGVQAWCIIGEQLVVATNGVLQIKALPKLDLVTETRLSATTAEDRTESAAISLTLAAALNRDQTILFVNDVSPLANAKFPLSVRVDEETMRVTSVDEFRKALVVERVGGRSHSVTARVVVGDSPESEAMIRRVPGGWYCDGYVFDNSGSKIICVFYFRSARPASRRLDQIVATNFANILTSNSSEISLVTVPATLEPARATNGLLSLVMRSLDKSETPVGDRIPLDATFLPTSELRGTRVDEQDCTFLCNDMAYLVRIQRFDAFDADFISPVRFRFIQPAITIVEDHSPSKFRFLEASGTENPPTVVAFPTRQSLEQQTRLFFHERSEFNQKDLESVTQQLRSYARNSRLEFEKTVGRQANGIPVPIWISAKLNWQNPRLPTREMHYCVWTEWTERAILDLLFREILAQQRATDKGLEQEKIERLRQQQEELRAKLARQLAEEKQKQKLVRDRQILQAGFSIRFVWSAVLVGLAIAVAVGYRLLYRNPPQAPTAIGAAIYLLALFPALAIGQESVPAIDGDAVRMQLPFMPTQLYISQDGKWAVIRRDSAVETVGKLECTFAAVDLERRQVTAERRFAETPNQSSIGRNYLLLGFASSRQLISLSLPDLKDVASRQLEPGHSLTAFVYDRFVQVGSKRWETPSLKDATGEWAADATAAGSWGERGRVYSTEGKWFIDGFHYTPDLQKPVAFCGHPLLFQSVVTNVSRSQASLTANTKARPLAPFLMTLGNTYALADGACLLQIVAPFSFPYVDSVPAKVGDQEEIQTRTPRLWVRLQVILPESQRRTSILPGDRLLAKIPVDLPGFEIPDLYARDLKVPLTMSTERCIAAIRQELLIFTLDQSALNRLPTLPRLIDGSIPVIVDYESTTKVEPQLSTGAAIERITGTFGTAKISSSSSGFELAPAQLLEQFQMEPLFAALSQSVRVSPKATFDQFASLFREKQSQVLRRLEALSGRSVQGIPLSVPLQLLVTGTDQSFVEVGRCIVIDVPPELFRDLFQQTQARRLARLSPPPQVAAAVEKFSSPIDLASNDTVLPDLSTPTAPTVSTPLPSSKSNDPTSVDKQATQIDACGPQVEVAVNLVFSMLIVGILLPVSCRLYRSGLPPGESFIIPSWRQMFVVTLVTCLEIAAIESLLVNWGRKCIQLESWPAWVTVLVVLLIALFFRFFVAVLGTKTVLRLAFNEVAAITFFLSLLAFIPTCMFLLGFLSLTVVG